jgi:hypothetical protein
MAAIRADRQLGPYFQRPLWSGRPHAGDSAIFFDQFYDPRLHSQMKVRV